MLFYDRLGSNTLTHTIRHTPFKVFYEICRPKLDENKFIQVLGILRKDTAISRKTLFTIGNKIMGMEKGG